MKRLVPMLAVGVALVAAGCQKPAAEKAATPAAAPASPVVATVNGETITMKDLDDHVRVELRQLERQRVDALQRLRQEGLTDMVARRLVAAEAKKLGKTEEQYLEQELGPKLGTPPTAAEIKTFYEQNKRQIPVPFEQAQGQIAQFLMQRRQQELMAQLLERLKSAGNVTVTLPLPEYPKVEVAATGPARGPETAPVKLVVFSDFQCPYCANVKPLLDQVASAYPDKVQIVFRDFPLGSHPLAPKAAEAGHCANDQGKFWALHDRLFAHQSQLEIGDLKLHAREVGLDSAAFDACLDGGKHAETVRKNFEAGRDAGVTGTPALFVNGRLVPGVVAFDELKKVIDQELGVAR